MSQITQKITTREALVIILEKLKRAGKKIGFTSGAFDLLHAGHVQYLEKAKEHCDILVAALNSDASVKKYKGEGRPLSAQQDRAVVLAGLESVDFVFIFEENNNKENIITLKPDFYIKAADYNEKTLSSAALVESYGGKVILIPLTAGKSTSGLIAKLSQGADSPVLQHIEYTPAPAVFVDRDGTIIEFVEYLHEPEKVKCIPGAVEALKSLRNAGYRIVMVTNQPGIGMGYYTKDDFYKVNKALFKAVSQHGLYFDRVYFCPHHVGEPCQCRKPNTLMVERAVKEINIIKEKSFTIGDTSMDVELGINSGCTPILVETGMAGNDKPEISKKAAYRAKDLSQAAEWILLNDKGYRARYIADGRW